MKLNLTCRLNNTSYGIVGTNLLRTFAKQYQVAYWPIGELKSIQIEQENIQLVQESLANRERYDGKVPSVRHCHQNDLGQHVGKGLHVGSTVFELNKFSETELCHLRQQDVLVTASKWGVDVFKNNGLRQPMVVMPHGVDREIFNENIPAGMKFNNNPTVFMNVSKKEIRKGHYELIEAFNKAFGPKDNVVLVMCWYNRFYTEEENKKWDDLYKNSALGHKIHIIPGFLNSQKEIAPLYATADCGIYPSKAEGFGLGPLEMMSMGKSVILTNYSGHTEYATHENSLLIEKTELETAYDGFWFHGQAEWMALLDSQVDQMIECMRRVHKDKQEGRLTPNKEGIETAKRFSWDNAVKPLVEYLNEIHLEKETGH